MTHTLASSSATGTTQYLMEGTLQYMYCILLQGSRHLHLYCRNLTTVPCCSQHESYFHVQMLPNKSTVQTPVHLGVFSHDVTRMVYSPPPSSFFSGKYIYTFHGGCVVEGGEEKKKKRECLLYYNWNFCTNW